MTGSISIRRHGGAAAFLARAEAWLMADETEHNLPLAIAARLQEPGHGYQEPILLATVEENGEVAGCAVRTPPHLLILTRMPPAALEPLVEAVAGTYESLPKLLGPEPEATGFAQLWSRKRETEFRLGTRMLIHALEGVSAPPPAARGEARPARMEDLPLAHAWAEAFARELESGPEIPGRIEGLIRNGRLWFWDDGGPRAMAAQVGSTPAGARIGLVYTPSDHRSRGFATRVTAALSARLLAEGKRRCFLFTDQANPVSNAIYARIGYRPVLDMVEIAFRS